MAIQQYNRMLGFLPLLCGQSFQKSRCKKLLKISISRIQLLKNRRAVQVKQLRRDVAQLLQFGQEPSALTRLARLWKEQNLLSAYDTIGEYCKLVIPNLANIGGQRLCPKDLVEPLSSLIFAASSCADLPELQDLREILATKYGNEFVTAVQELPDSRVNELILESFSSRGPSEAAKQALLEGIAKEYDLSLGLLPRISAPPFPRNVENISLNCRPGPLEENRPVSFPESNRLAEGNEKLKWTPTSVRNHDVLDSCGRGVARDYSDDRERIIRIKLSKYRREEQAEHAVANLDHSHNVGSFDRRNEKAIYSSGRDDYRGTRKEFLHWVEREAFEPPQPTGIHDSRVGKVCERSVEPLLESDFAVTRNGDETLTYSEKAKEAKSCSTRGIVSGSKIIDPDEVTLVLSNDNGPLTEIEHNGSISLFIPKTLPCNFPEPPLRPPPPPPVRVASSPSLSIQSPPKVTYQRSSTLETYRFEEHRDAHVHPKLPEYDDLVARFAALRRNSLKQ